LRIVAGTYRGRRLKSPPGHGTRPTTDRVREALFNILGGSVQGTAVLDCFAGSGALGIEALSRGAARVVFVEKSRQAADVVEANLELVGLVGSDSAVVVNKPLERSFGALQQAGPFDLWLVDPPFAMVRDGTATRVLASMTSKGLLAETGTVVLEYPSDQPCPEIRGLIAHDLRDYGDSHLAFFGPGAGVATVRT
jgi:16S rRNA (guanine966-N2)-methyltransferase